MAYDVAAKQQATLTKDNLPVLYSHLMEDLEKYKISHERISLVKSILFQLGLLSRELATQRLNLVTSSLISNLSSRNIKYVEGRTNKDIESIGSAEIQVVYAEIQSHLTNAQKQNDGLTRRYNESPGRLLQADAGELSSIINRYLNIVSESIRVLNAYQEGQPDSQYALSQVRYVYDNFMSSVGLRKCKH